MATQYQAMFEALPTHEGHPYTHPYSAQEFEDEWEGHPEGHPYSHPYSAQEFEGEWEGHPEGHPYSHPYSAQEFEDEWEGHPEGHPYSHPYSAQEFEGEWEGHPEGHPYSHPYSAQEFEDEWEGHPEGHPYSHPYSAQEFEDEWEGHPYSNQEDEGEYFFKKAFGSLGRSLGRGFKAVMKAAGPLAKQIAPMLAGKLARLIPIPGVNLVAGPIAQNLTRQLLKEGEMEAMQMEAEFFGTNEAEAEVANNETAQEAALTEFLAAQAAEASTEAEAEAAIGATLPITITIMGGRRALRRVMPVLTQANATMVRTLVRQGPTGQQLLRLVPTFQRRAFGALKAAARAGKPINSATAVKAMASAAYRVLNNPKTVQKAIVRNAVLQQRTAPPNPRRTAAGVGMRNCPACAQRAQQRRAAIAR